MKPDFCALNDTATAAQVVMRRQLPSIFDRPTPFTMNSIGVQRATKATLEARVFVKDKQAEYLELQETDGTRQPKKRAILLRRAKPTFSGKIDGVPGLWQRLKGGGATHPEVAGQLTDYIVTLMVGLSTMARSGHDLDRLLATARLASRGIAQALRA